ncbi:MAG: magnesium and cobalt transport protein CorA, partial [Proteobacteria bacterium]|nr:magnesium and cobalt transport protein CorA [Pseudomonadota bacterium]
MSRFIKRSTKKAGTAPGTLVHVGDRKMDHTRISLMDYDQDHLTERELESIEASFPFKDAPRVTWINVIGLHDIGLLEKIGHHFGIHPLVLEDIVHTGQRPKFEDFDDYLYTVFKMLTYDSQTGHVRSEQV